MKENATIFYRTTSGEGSAPRPSWYNKELCLYTLCLAMDAFSLLGLKAKLVVLHDGEIKNNPHQKGIKSLVEPRGEILELLPKLGNSKSCLKTLEKAASLSREKIAVFAEDDYLWLLPAIIGLTEALTQTPADYATPYDHPVRYQPDYPGGADWPHWNNQLYLTPTRHWHSQESTCMTFATTAKALTEDLSIFAAYIDNGRGIPGDRETFRHLQGLGKYESQTERRRLLVGPLPGLAVHADLRGLNYSVPYVINWQKEAERVRGV